MEVATKRVKTGGRQKGTPNALPDLRAITLRALMKAGGVDYLVRQASENPMGFMSLLGRVMPREAHVELSGELKVRQEVRRDLVEKVIVLMREPPATERPAIEGNAEHVHNPEAMLRAQKEATLASDSKRLANVRNEGAAHVAGITHRAAAMHVERPRKAAEHRSYMEEALERIDGRSARNAVPEAFGSIPETSEG